MSGQNYNSVTTTARNIGTRLVNSNEIQKNDFRGFLLSRVEEMFGRHWLSTAVAIVFQGAIFGLIHYYYQGAFGAITIFAAACFIGFCYVMFGRNLWPLILSHGVLDTLGFLGDFLGDSGV